MEKKATCGNIDSSVKELKLASISQTGTLASYLVQEGLIGTEDGIGAWESQHITDTSKDPWKMVCSIEVVFSSGSFRGTGWFAGPKTVVTAAHNLYKPSVGMAKNCFVIPGYADPLGPTFEMPFGSHESRLFMIPSEWPSSFSAQFDFAAIQLDVEPIGASSFGIKDSAEVGTIANIAGYPVKFGGARLHHSFDQVTKVLDRIVLYSIDTDNGVSGAPVFVIGHDGKPYVQAIHGYGVEGSVVRDLGIDANYGPRMTPDVINTIKRWIDIA
jgi:V8-like Glu-specific endopeptidase